MALSAAAAAMLWMGASSAPGPRASNPGELVAKGAAGPVLLASCPGRPTGDCHLGDRLIFEVEGAQKPGFFAAYAECAGRERIWYFPSANGTLPEIDPNQTRNVVSQAARIGAEHGVGHCELHLFALPEKISRAALIAGAADRFRTDLALEVTP